MDKIKKSHLPQLMKILKKNKVVKSDLTMQILKKMFAKLPLELSENIYHIYNDMEILKLKKKIKNKDYYEKKI